MILHSRPWITDADQDAVAAALRSEQIGQGDATARFEEAFSRWLEVEQRGVALASGAAALTGALISLDVGAGDEVVMPTYVCRSVRDAVIAAGATPRLADVGPEFVITPATVAPLVGPRTQAIVVPHTYGIFADVAAFRQFGVPIVEDCAQAVDRPSRHRLTGDIAVFSFHPTKCLTFGEGGFAVSRDPLLSRRLRAARDGDSAGRIRRVPAPCSSLSAALGWSQLARYGEMLERRRRIASAYRAALGDAAAVLLRRTPWDRTMHFRFVVSSEAPFERSAATFARRGVVVRRGVDELMHRLAGEDDAAFPVAAELFETTVSIPIYPALSEAERAICADALAEWAGACETRSELQPALRR
jgi:UDP-4-amino-4-deoxy-L-arabinose-oxoglutarate aminotransferase